MRRIYLTIDIECHDIKKRNLYIDGSTHDGSCGLEHILKLAKGLSIPVNCFLDIPEAKVYADTSALERDFGFKPHTPLREGLRKFAEWYKEFYMA